MTRERGRVMRVATLNILHGRAPSDGAVDLDRFRQGIATLGADVLVLQEVDQHQPRSCGVDLAALAAEATGAVDHRFAPALHGRADDGWGAARDDAPPGTPAYGIAVLSRWPVQEWRVLRLHPPRRRVPFRHHGDVLPSLVAEEPRVALAAHIDAPSGAMTVVGTHLSFVRLTNGRQLTMLRDSLTALRPPTLLVGDLNMGVDRAERLTGMSSLVDAATFPGDQPKLQLDHVLADDAGWVVQHAEARELRFSDHRALVVDLARRPL